MRRSRQGFWRWLPAGLVAVLAAALPASAGPSVVQVTRVDLEIRTMTDPAPEKPFQLSFAADEPARLRFELDWPTPDRRVEIELRASGTPGAADETTTVKLEAYVTLPTGDQIHAARQAVFTDRGTLLFEVYREDGRPLTLAINASTRTETVALKAPTVGRAVALRLEIQRVEGQRRVLLETNDLNTFVGHSVSYEFRLGSTPESDALMVRLRPMRLVSEIVEIEIEISGRLADGESVMVISRRENLITSRGAASNLLVTSGDPPAGYRFVVTPQF